MLSSIFAVSRTRGVHPFHTSLPYTEWVCKKKTMSSFKTHHHDSIPTLLRWRPQRKFLVITAIVMLAVLPFLVKGLPQSTSASRLADRNREEPLSDAVSVQARGRSNPTINLSDGHGLLTSYVGPEELQVALKQNQAEPLSLATADLDEDGVPDLVSGYGYQGRGIVSLMKGNVDSNLSKRSRGTATESQRYLH